MEQYGTLQARHGEGFFAAVQELTARLAWTREQIDLAQTTALRAIVSTARERSPWHGARLADVDLDELTADDVSDLPTMTKVDLMTNWDRIVTDPRLTLDAVNQHLESITTDAYLVDEYHAIASGGSSGQRGVFVWGWEPWLTAFVSTVRWSARYAMKHPEVMGQPVVVALVAADAPTHMSSALPQTFATPGVAAHRMPVTQPMATTVAQLNAIQPTQLRGYASALAQLAREQLAGRLQIAPFTIAPDGEPLLPEMREAMERAWGAPVGGYYGTSEACTTAASCFMGAGMHLSDDLVLVEPVDAQGRPVAPGELSDKILLTNLYNPVLPLIRYEITDRVRLLREPCPCGCAFRRIDDVEGRLDHVFRYGDVVIHPHVFRSPLSREPAIVEYQVRQTERGADIDLRIDAPIDIDALAQDITHHLADAGLEGARVKLQVVDAIERTAAGKQRRFVPLSFA
ncbi:MAG TPA: hypothetical protein VMK16_18815 [Acidimicrobiales bacterium]|nr:hypothetical protein [Acidimicrobiales bacterium]